MITLIEALNFRCLRYVRQPLGPFHVLVGPNASGKTTFLDIPALLGRLVSDGLDAAVRDRTQNFEEMVWQRKGRSVELAIEARIPEERRPMLESPAWDTIRYEVALGLQATGDAQLLLATHSPVILSIVEPKDVLCFAKSAEGATDIVAGSDHPALRKWQGETNLGVLFASGVLG
jgi:predicted ATPase